MTASRRLRWLWFAGIFCLLPWPWPVVEVADPLVPALRYAILAAAALAVVVAEGGGGLVGVSAALLGVWAVVTGLGSWTLAWIAGKLVTRWAPRRGAALTLGVLGLGICASVWLAGYRTPFGRAPTGGLFEILW